MYRLLGIIFCLSVTSCATGNPPFYTYEDLISFKVGSTSEEVIEQLGLPHIKLQEGRLWVYGRTRVIMTDGLAYQHDYHAILIEFVDGKVAHKDRAHGKSESQSACWNNRLCLEPVWDIKSIGGKKPKKLSRKYSAVTSRRQDDELAKEFFADDDKCAIYVYAGLSIGETLSVTLDTLRDEPVPDAGYVFFQSLPRQLQIKAGKNVVDFECEAGSLDFYKLSHYPLTSDDDILIKQVGLDEGKKAVRKRYRLLTW